MSTIELNDLIEDLKQFQSNYYLRSNAMATYELINAYSSRFNFENSQIRLQFEGYLEELKYSMLAEDINDFARKYAYVLLKLMFLLKRPDAIYLED